MKPMKSSGVIALVGVLLSLGLATGVSCGWFPALSHISSKLAFRAAADTSKAVQIMHSSTGLHNGEHTRVQTQTVAKVTTSLSKPPVGSSREVALVGKSEPVTTKKPEAVQVFGADDDGYYGSDTDDDDDDDDSEDDEDDVEAEEEEEAKGSSVLFGFDYVREYEKINNKLVDEVESDAVIDNLMEAVKWEKEKYIKVKSSLFTSQIDSRALIQFTSLLRLLDPENHNCNLIGHSILKSNVEATGQNLMVPDDAYDGLMRRIDDIVRTVATEHAKQCKYSYPEQFKNFKEGRETDMIYADLRNFLNRIIKTSKRRIFAIDGRKDERMVLAERAFGIDNVRETEHALVVQTYLKLRSRDDPDNKYLYVHGDPRSGKRTVNEAKVSELVDRYVMNQCEYLIKRKGYIMLPALYEQQLFPISKRYKAIDENYGEFILWLQYFRICSIMVNEDRDILKRNIVRAIWSQ